MDKLSAVRKDRRLPVCIEEDKMEQLLDQLQSAELFADLRDLLMLELLYGTGMRLSELIGLRHSDVDEMRGRVLITGKGNKQRSVPLLGEVLQVYERYVAEKQKVFGSDFCDWVFVTNKGAQLYPGFVYRRVRHYLGRVSTRTRKSPHVLRHSFATHMLNRGAELNAIKKLLGHSSLAATQVYTHNTIDKIKQVYKQAHPKA
ncbi:MAG: tyrosine-type recombinase/integrase [Bacteroidales bacterium]|nr:tyrosine-type recombinase/integrase [Bacteroidales bacterium]